MKPRLKLHLDGRVVQMPARRSMSNAEAKATFKRADCYTKCCVELRRDPAFAQMDTTEREMAFRVLWIAADTTQGQVPVDRAVFHAISLCDLHKHFIRSGAKEASA